MKLHYYYITITVNGAAAKSAQLGLHSWLPALNRAKVFKLTIELYAEITNYRKLIEAYEIFLYLILLIF